MSGLIRCFIAAEIPEHVLREIGEYIEKLRPLTSDVRWVRTSGMHVTLKFLGEIPESSVEMVRDKLAPIRIPHKVFDLTARESGFFPSRKNPRVIWIGLEQDKENSLFRIHQWVDDVLVPLNFQREKRKYSPHITVGRIKGAGNFNKLLSYLEACTFPAVTFKVESIKLIRSILKPQGAEYSVIESYPLAV